MLSDSLVFLLLFKTDIFRVQVYILPLHSSSKWQYKHCSKKKKKEVPILITKTLQKAGNQRNNFSCLQRYSHNNTYS